MIQDYSSRARKRIPTPGSHRSWLALLAMFFCGSSLSAQISPGPLSKAHQSLSGSTQCTSCHVFGKGSAVLDCQGCHTEIAQELVQNRGLHATFANRTDCAKCHSEHNGEDFPLIHWQPSLKGFDYNQTGYPLQGKHTGIECNSCHTPSHVSASVRSLIKMMDMNRTFFGLTQSCVTCHNDVHHGQLGQNCLQCHNFTERHALRCAPKGTCSRCWAARP
jgi:Cytochrome c7 and related cytochrome c